MSSDFELNAGRADLNYLRESIDKSVVELLNGEIESAYWSGLQAMFPEALPEGFLETWANKGTWAVNTMASQPKRGPSLPQDTKLTKPLDVALTQHFVQRMLFAALERTAGSERTTVDIVDSLRIELVGNVVVATVTVLTFIVARKMWHLYPRYSHLLASTPEHFSFGEAVAELLITPEFEGITFKKVPDDESQDIELTRQDVADILRQHQAKTHQDVVRKDNSTYSFMESHVFKVTPPFSEGLIGLLADIRDPNNERIAAWLLQCKKDFGRLDTSPDLATRMAKAMNCISSERREVSHDFNSDPSTPITDHHSGQTGG